MRIGFIGFGNMAQAIVKGLVTYAQVDPETIHVCAAHYETCKERAKKWGVCAHPQALDVIQASDIVVIAVKPYQISAIVSEVKHSLKDRIVVSIAAGCFYDFYEQILEPGTHHISTVPNTPVAVGEGIFVVEDHHSLNDDQLDMVRSLFSKIALWQPIDSDHMSVAGTIAGCAPAYTAMYMEALADAGVKHGLKRDQAYALAAKMIQGTGALYMANKEHPGQMKDAVCSPGGTTIRGVASLEKNAFRGIVIEAIDAVEQSE